MGSARAAMERWAGPSSGLQVQHAGRAACVRVCAQLTHSSSSSTATPALAIHQLADGGCVVSSALARTHARTHLALPAGLTHPVADAELAR